MKYWRDNANTRVASLLKLKFPSPVNVNLIFPGVSTVGEYCKNLSELSVTDCRDVTEQSLSRLRQRGVKIDRQLDPVLLRLLRIRNEQRHARLQI